MQKVWNKIQSTETIILAIWFPELTALFLSLKKVAACHSRYVKKFLTIMRLPCLIYSVINLKEYVCMSAIF